MKKTLTICLLAIIAFSNKSWGQDFAIDPVYYTIFDRDSLAGFDEEAARASAISEQFYGSEFKIRMFRLKREYINNKYNLIKPIPANSAYNNFLNAKPAAAAVPGCVNEDFEASTPGVITATNQIAGWVVTQGYNGYVSSTSAASLQAAFPNGLQNANSCNLLGCCPMTPAHSELIDCTGGYVDQHVGPQYPIYSVFGSGAANAAASAVNPQVSGGMFGNKVIRVNDGVTGDYSVEKLSKTFSVTAQNALFQFAFISVFNPGHGCCDAGGFQIRLTNATANTVIPCPNFSVSAPGPACTATVPVDYFVGTPGSGTNTPGTAYNTNMSVQYIYNRWKVNSMDLTAYIGQNITIDIIVSDCTAGGHFGKVYFDAQCGPMTIFGNGNPFAADIANVMVPTCGAAGATICAANGLGPYSWAGPNLDPNQTVPSMTNQCITTSVSATYTLYMQPQGSCLPISRLVTSTITPAPLLNISVLQATCGNSLAIVSATPAGSASNPPFISWTPAPQVLSTNSTIATYTIPATPNATNIISATASDNVGCLVTTTAGVNSAPPIPSFTINNNTGSYSITCSYPQIDLEPLTNYNYNGGALSYFWASASSTFATNSVSIVNPGSYTVNGFDPITNCGITKTVSIGVNTVAPSSVVTPTLQNITCTVGSITNVTATANPSVNITHSFLSPLGGSYVANTHTVVYTPGSIGEYTYCLTDDNNGCSTCKVFTVTSSDGFPTYNVTSPQNFTLGCGSTSIAVINIINANTFPIGGGALTYTIIGPGTSTAIAAGNLSGLSTYSVTLPGTYTVITRDNNNFCDTKTPISILSNTFQPNVSAIVPSQVLDCNNPITTLKGMSVSKNISFDWSFGTNLQQGDTLTVGINVFAPTATLVGNYSITVTDNSSTCKSTSVIPIFQNTFKPNALISNGGVPAISCKTNSLVLSNISSSGITPASGFPVILPVIGYLWQGPTPQDPLANSSTYEGRVPGVYTLTAKDLNNGCISTATMNIIDDRDYPTTAPISEVVLQCGSTTTSLSPMVTSPSNASIIEYFWTTPAGATVTSQTDKSILATMTGEYGVDITNKDNGCKISLVIPVISGSLTANFVAADSVGFTPMSVSLNNLSYYNTSPTATSNVGITSVWSFGNGVTLTNLATNTTNYVYNSPGTYTVTMYAQRGTCMEMAQKIITVESSSELSIPNIFTPNKDGVNDLFFVRMKNLNEISVVIHDRWGHKVYELVNSNNGNIQWDGMNQQGKEVPEGTYFYIIKATGKDGQAYDKHGTITLVR